MSILVTGGAGFIGSHLVDHLLSTTDAEIILFDDFSTGSRSNIEHVIGNRLDIRDGDIRDASTVHDVVSSADTVYHLAAAVGVQKIVEAPLESLKTNLSGTKHVLEAAAKDGTPIFIASSSEVYGKKESVPFSEADDRVLGPITSQRWSYAAAKAVDEHMTLGYHNRHDLPIIIGRFFNVVGPRQSGQYGMVIPTFVDQALSGDPLTVYGDGTQTRSFTHVSDAVKAIQKLVNTHAARGDVFNIGTPNPISINNLAEYVIELTGSDSEITHVPFEKAYSEDFDEPAAREPDIKKLREVLGWAPATDIDRILRDIISERTGQEVTANE